MGLMKAEDDPADEPTDVGSPIVTDEVSAMASPLGTQLLKRKKKIDKQGRNDGSTFGLGGDAKDGALNQCDVGASPVQSRMRRNK